MRTRNQIIRGVAYTSIESFKQLLASGQNIREMDIVYSLLKETGQPMNSREISIKTGIERTNITRTLYDLEDSNFVKVAKIDKCPITNRLVNFYTYND